MFLHEIVSRRLLEEKRLRLIPPVIIEAIVKLGFEDAARLDIFMPRGPEAVERVLDGDQWEECEGCQRVLWAETAHHDVEGVPLCPDCYKDAEKAEEDWDGKPVD